MILHHRIACAFIVSAIVLNATEAGQPKPASRETAARAFIELLAQGEFAKATETFDATMLKVLPAAELKKTWEKVTGDAGAYKKALSSRQETKDKHEIVIVTCEFAKAKLDARVIFDKDAKIAGLFFAPAKKPRPTGKEEIYEGTLKVGEIELPLVFHFFLQKDGSYAGTLDSPAQGAKDLVLDELTIKDGMVHLEWRAGKVVYEGKRNKEGTEIVGTFKQLGQMFPLTLRRVEKASELRRPQTPKKPYPYDEIEVAYENKKQGIKLAGALTVPKSGGPFPAVLLITGSGPQDRDETIMGHKPFLVLADHLTRRGIAVLRVDDRGVGGSTGNVNDATLADFALDVRAGVEFLKSRKEIDSTRIGLLGHSEGGIVAPLVASQSKDIAFVILLAGTGVPGEAILYEQGSTILKMTGAKPERVALQKTMQERMFAVIRAEKDNAVAEKKLRAVMEELTSTLGKTEKEELLKAQPLFEGQLKVVLSPWFRSFLDHDPRPALRKVTCPVLALNGARDVQVDARLNLAAITAALKEAGNKDVTTKEFADLNHLFQTCKTGAISEYALIEETIAPVVLDTIAKWIAKRTTDK